MLYRRFAKKLKPHHDPKNKEYGEEQIRNEIEHTGGIVDQGLIEVCINQHGYNDPGRYHAHPCNPGAQSELILA